MVPKVIQGVGNGIMICILQETDVMTRDIKISDNVFLHEVRIINTAAER